ncbi:hypothetical protein AGOR_G00204700, partial [Albula goreensis]
MVETEAESKSVEESSNLDTSDQSDGDKRLSKGSMHAENSSEAAVAQDESGGDCQTFGKVDSIAGSAPVEPKEAESVEEQGKDQKPMDQHTCSHCGRMFCDKPSLAMHVKKCHSKGTNFFCEPCSYACVDKSNFEKHCSSNKHKMKVKESTDALSHTLTAGDGNKLEGTLKTTAQVQSESSAGVTTAQLQLKAQNSTACRNAKATSKGEDQVVKEVISGELIQEYVQEALPSESQKSSGENTLTEDDTEKIKEAPPGIQQCDAAGSTDELAEKSPLKKRRGRPKGSTTTTCQYCGLVASNATNLSVHIRRRHSREYGFICKVCSYSCVTKGDMDRHCATKKHMKRVKGTKDDQSQDSSVKVVEVVVSGSQQREGEAPKGEDQEEAGSTLSTGKRTTSHLQDESQALTDDAQTGSADPEDDTAELTGPASKKSKYDSVNTCTYCGFVAHSLPSLELHVKRKHTRDFEFVCLACNYYAVTCREMSRHATTDKHRQKSQSYLEFLGTNEGGVTQLDVSAEAVPDSGPGDQNVTFSGSTSVQESASDKDRQADAESHPDIPSPNGEIAASCDGKEALNQAEQDGAEVGVEIRAEHQAVLGEDDIEEVTVGQGRIQPMNDPENAEPKDRDYASNTGDTQATSMVDSPVTEVSEGHAASPAQESAGVEAESEVEDDGVLEGSSDAEGELADGSVDSPSASKVLLRALPFDASIVPFRALFEGDVSTLPGKKAAPRQRVTTPAAAANALKKTKVPTRSSGATKGGGAARIRCEDCGFMADGLSGLNVHVSMKHPSKDKHFHCLLCGKSFYTESNLHQHLTSAAHLRNEQASIKELPEGGASFKCVKCSDPFVTEQDLFHHIKDKHEELLREVNKYVLEDTEQINREREENQGCVCKYCGKVCKSSNSMAFLAHVRTHTGSKPFKCKLCDFATAQLGDARNHVKRHLGVREYKCPVCGWAFVMKKHLNTHMLGKHGVGQPKERKFECELCDRSFSEKWSLNNHMKLHTGAKPYKCTWPACHYSFLTMSAMKDHYRTHTGEKSFLCDLCGFAGGTRHALTKHRRQHTGEKPFKCHLCSFASTTQSHLTRHRRVHTGEKPYHCPWCHYRSNCAENIRKHILHTGKHEGVKMYNCPKCEYGTNAPMDFRNHLKELHPDIENPDLAYLHAGIVSKSFECRLKGQGASFVKADAATFVKAESGFAGEEGSPDQALQDGTEEPAVQQFIIIQGYGEDYAIDSTLEESAAATLQTLAMGGQVAEVLHITEDGQVIGGTPGDAHQLAAG